MVRDCPTLKHFNPRTPRGVRHGPVGPFRLFCDFNPRTPRGVRPRPRARPRAFNLISIHAPREGCDEADTRVPGGIRPISIHAPREGCDETSAVCGARASLFQSTHPARGATLPACRGCRRGRNFNPRTPRGVRQQTLPKSREFAWLNLLICTRGRRLSIQKQTRLCSIKLSFMLFGCEPAGEGVSSWTSHATKSKVRLEGRSAYSQSVRSSAHSDFPGNKSGGCPVRDP